MKNTNNHLADVRKMVSRQNGWRVVGEFQVTFKLFRVGEKNEQRKTSTLDRRKQTPQKLYVGMQ